MPLPAAAGLPPTSAAACLPSALPRPPPLPAAATAPPLKSADAAPVDGDADNADADAGYVMYGGTYAEPPVFVAPLGPPPAAVGEGEQSVAAAGAADAMPAADDAASSSGLPAPPPPPPQLYDERIFSGTAPDGMTPKTELARLAAEVRVTTATLMRKLALGGDGVPDGAEHLVALFANMSHIVSRLREREAWAALVERAGV